MEESNNSYRIYTNQNSDDNTCNVVEPKKSPVDIDLLLYPILAKSLPGLADCIQYMKDNNLEQG